MQNVVALQGEQDETFIARLVLADCLVTLQQCRKIKLINIVSSGTDEKQTAN